MTRVLLVGLAPDAVDFFDPALPPGLNADRIQAGIDEALQKMSERGWQAEPCLIRPDETAGPELERRLAAAHYDCIVIGAGVRMPPRQLHLLETLINTARKLAPATPVAFNTMPEDTPDAAARWLPAA